MSPRRLSVPAWGVVVFLLAFASPAFAERVLRFPEDEAVGTVYVADAGKVNAPRDDETGDSWTRLSFESFPHFLTSLGPARGEITVPEGHLVRLDTSLEDLPRLTDLPEGSIDALTIRRVFGHGGNDETDDAPLPAGAVEAVRRQTNLRMAFLPASLVRAGVFDKPEPFDRLDFLLITRPDDAVTGAISRLPLKSVMLRGGPLTAAGFEALAACRTLESLSLENVDVDTAAVERLVTLPRLRSLSLGGYGMGDETMPVLAKARGLRELYLFGTAVTASGLAALAPLDGLESLSIDDRMNGNAVVEHLPPLPNLRMFSAGGAGLTDDALAKLATRKTLEHLHISGNTAVTDAGLAEL